MSGFLNGIWSRAAEADRFNPVGNPFDMPQEIRHGGLHLDACPFADSASIRKWIPGRTNSILSAFNDNNSFGCSLPFLI